MEYIAAAAAATASYSVTACVCVCRCVCVDVWQPLKEPWRRRCRPENHTSKKSAPTAEEGRKDLSSGG